METVAIALAILAVFGFAGLAEWRGYQNDKIRRETIKRIKNELQQEILGGGSANRIAYLRARLRELGQN